MNDCVCQFKYVYRWNLGRGLPVQDHDCRSAWDRGMRTTEAKCVCVYLQVCVISPGVGSLSHEGV